MIFKYKQASEHDGIMLPCVGDFLIAVHLSQKLPYFLYAASPATSRYLVTDPGYTTYGRLLHSVELNMLAILKKQFDANELQNYF